MKQQDVEAEIAFFNKFEEEKGHFDTVSENVYAQIFKLINPYIGNEILEAGCGSGAFGIRIIKNKKCNIAGIDLNEKFTVLAKESGIYKDVICGNIEDVGVFECDQFDTIICPYLLHHLPSMQKTIDNFYFWLKPGGYFITIDPNGSNLIMKLSYFLRIFLSYFINTSSYASINEAHKSVREFKKCMKRFKIVGISTFEHKESAKFRSSGFSLLSVLGSMRGIFLKLYKILPFVKYKNSDLIIIAQKND